MLCRSIDTAVGWESVLEYIYSICLCIGAAALGKRGLGLPVGAGCLAVLPISNCHILASWWRSSQNIYSISQRTLWSRPMPRRQGVCTVFTGACHIPSNQYFFLLYSSTSPGYARAPHQSLRTNRNSLRFEFTTVFVVYYYMCPTGKMIIYKTRVEYRILWVPYSAQYNIPRLTTSHIAICI